MSTALTSTVSGYQAAARGRDRRVVALTLACSALVTAVFFAYPPGWFAVLLCACVAFAVLTWYRPVFGVALVLVPTLLFEQYEFAVYRPITRLVPFFEAVGGGGTDGGGFKASPLELMLLAVGVIVMLRATAGRKGLRRSPVAAPVTLFSVALVAWTAYGLLTGGSLNTAVWELRALAYFCLLALVVPQALESQRDVRLVMWTAIVMVGIKSAQGMWNLYAIRQDDLGVRSITSHEDAVFIAWMVILLLAMLLYRPTDRQCKALLAFAPLMALTFFKTDRRAAYVALAVGMAFLVVMAASDRTHRQKLVKWGVPLMLAVLFVVGIGWEMPGPVGAPAAVVRSIVAPDNPEDAGSSQFRTIEQLNLMQSIGANPVLGIGFGRPFQQPGQNGIAILHYELANVIAHNSVFWIWAVMGTVGFGVFWVMVGGLIVLGGLTFRTHLGSYGKALAVLVTCAVAMQVIVSFVDLQLTYARNMVFLGVLVGILAVLSSLTDDEVTSAG